MSKARESRVAKMKTLIVSMYTHGIANALYNRCCLDDGRFVNALYSFVCSINRLLNTDKPTGNTMLFGWKEYRRHDGSLYWTRNGKASGGMAKKRAIDAFYREQAIARNALEIADQLRKEEKENA